MASNNQEPAAASPPSTSGTESVPIPNDALIIVPVRNIVLFPGVVAPITINRAKSIAAAQQALREQRPIGILLQRNAEAEDPTPDDLYRICTVANIVRYITAPDETHHIICQGVQRARILDYLPGTPFPAAAPSGRGQSGRGRSSHYGSVQSWPPNHHDPLRLVG